MLYRNDAGTLVPTDTVLPGYWEDNDQADFDLRSITWADYDNDGDLDLLLPSIWDDDTFTSHTALMRNDGANGSGGWLFTEVAAGLGPSNHAQSSWADFDGDQDLDLLLVHIAPLTEDGFIRRFRNDGDGVFVGEDILGTLTVEHGEAQWGDYDDDGDLDILVAGNVKELDGTYNTVAAPLSQRRRDVRAGRAHRLRLLRRLVRPDRRHLGRLRLRRRHRHPARRHLQLRLADRGPRQGLRQRGRRCSSDSGNQLPAPRAMGFSGGSFSWLDIDGEGDLDYFIAGSYFVPGGNGLVETQMHLYLNDAAGENLAPTAPSLLDSQVLGDGSVALWWQPGERRPHAGRRR